MYNSLEETFKHHMKLEFNHGLYQSIKLFRITWAQKESEYIEFLGGKTLGTHAIRFSIRDDEELIVNILQMDNNQLAYDITNTKGITKGRAAENNVVYQSLVYLMHGFIKSSLPTKDKIDALKECYYIFAYKKFSSLMFHYFKYPADDSVAKVVYEKLSNRYLIKRLNNWQEVFEYRANDVLPGNFHYQRLYTYNTEDALRVITDLHAKLTDMFKNIYAITVKVTQSNERVLTDSLLTNIEGEDAIKDVNNSSDRYIKYLNSIITSKYDFAKVDLANLIATQQARIASLTLYNFLVHVSSLDVNFLQEVIEVSVTSSLELLREKNIQKDYNKHILKIIGIIKLVGVKKSSVHNKTLKVRKALEKEFIKHNPKFKTKAEVIATATLTYIFIRYFYKD